MVNSTVPRARCYAIIDEQSNSSFVDSKLVDHFGVNAPFQNYTLSTMSGSATSVQGRIVKGLKITGVEETSSYFLPPVFTNDSIPSSKDEVATPEIVRMHKSVSKFADKFLPKDENAEVLLLLGRDTGNVMKTKCYGSCAPFVHHTALGWALIGPVCTDTNCTVLNCPRKTLKTVLQHDHLTAKPCFEIKSAEWKLPEDSEVFKSETDDELMGPSKEDDKFMKLISETISINEFGNLQMPLPFKNVETKLPNNKDAVFRRTQNTLARIKTDENKLRECTSSMANTISAGHVETVPDNELYPEEGRAWWLPVFAIRHPKKHKIRLVFDSSASYHGTSLNNKLLKGPDQNNRIRGVLMRFREGTTGFVADIESMFHSFYVNKEHRDFLRFFWFKNNNPNEKLVQYRANVHIFGNKPSPSIAIFGLRHTTKYQRADNLPDAKNFIYRNFYMDDGLGCADSPQKAISILQDARAILRPYNIRLHKIMSNSPAVLAAFPVSERAENCEIVEFEEPTLQRTLGIAWDVKFDQFIIKVEIPERPFTKRGVLSTINSIFDPLGMVSPVILAGRLLQRKLIPPRSGLCRFGSLRLGRPFTRKIL